MGMLEDDLTEHPPRFVTEPRKVHLFHDQKGATYGSMGKQHRYADTLCKGNFAGPELVTTHDPALVTCKTCLKKMRYPARTGRAAGVVVTRDPLTASRIRIEIDGDYVEHRFAVPTSLARVRQLGTHFINALTEEL